MMWPARDVSGDLTLAGSRLTWRRKWALTWGKSVGPRHIEIDLNSASAAPAGSEEEFRPDERLTRIADRLVNPYWRKPGPWRECIAVQVEGEPEAYVFAVDDAQGWLNDIARAMPER
jgi:hypothetical protein